MIRHGSEENHADDAPPAVAPEGVPRERADPKQELLEKLKELQSKKALMDVTLEVLSDRRVKMYAYMPFACKL